MQEIFDRKWTDKVQEKPNEFAFEVLEHSRVRLHSSILEVDAGNGRDTELFAREGMAIDAVEISESGVQQLSKIKGEIAILRQDIRKLQLQKEKYDYVYSFSVLHYFKKEERDDIL